MKTPSLPFTEKDLARANAEWGCNCGPAALAACLNLTLDEIRPHFRNFRGFTNPTEMEAAIKSAGFEARRTHDWPDHGVARIQWRGPWMNPGVPAGAAYRRTHFVASSRGFENAWIYDVNAGWVKAGDWASEVVPKILATVNRSNGDWFATHLWEVRRSPSF